MSGGAVTEEGREGGEISYATYVEAVEKTQMKMFHESELGKDDPGQGEEEGRP